MWRVERIGTVVRAMEAAASQKGHSADGRIVDGDVCV